MQIEPIRADVTRGEGSKPTPVGRPHKRKNAVIGFKHGAGADRNRTLSGGRLRSSQGGVAKHALGRALRPNPVRAECGHSEKPIGGREPRDRGETDEQERRKILRQAIGNRHRPDG